MKKIVLLLSVGYLSSAIAADAIAKPATADKTKEMPEMTVTDANLTDRLFPNTSKATPSYTVDALDIKTKINATTSEDTLRYSPGVLIRKRYMGDPNGTLGIRGSNSFQTAHSMVYGDGMPLHNPLRTTFSGAPRWSMVSPSEIEFSEVLYGPFSAQYSGNSMGGVVNLITKMPDKFEAQVDAMGMFQTMHRSGRNETLDGFKTFVSAGNRFDKFSIWGSYNHLENEGQPQTINAAAQTTPLTGTAAQRTAQAALGRVTGGENYQLATAAPAIAYGDIGTSQPITDLYKMKMGYDFTEDLQGRFTFAYENRQDTVDNPNSLLRNANGTTNWGGATAATKANPNGGGLSANTNYYDALFNKNIVVPGSVFGVSTTERNAYNYGLSLKGKISTNWKIDTTASYYDAKNHAVSSNLNPNHPLNQNKGQIVDEKPWWATYDLKLATDKFLGRDDLSFMGGYQFNHATLGVKTYSSNNYAAGTTNAVLNDNGGTTQTNALFSQMEWRFLPDWSLMAGARYDIWQASDGHAYDYTLPATSKLRIQNYENRDASRISPKASIEFSPNAWTFRYSFSKAYRFPIAEEMFTSQSRLNSQTIAFPGLGPEHGLFNNFMVQYDLPRGYVRANIFYDKVGDEIANTQQTINGQTTTTFLPIDQTKTVGVDLTFQQNEVFKLPVDLMLNTTIMDKEITKNARNQILVGNQWDRIPRLQINGTVTYHIMPVWDGSVGVRYRSDSFQTLTNTDVASQVMGGTDESTFVDLKTVYKLPVYKNLKSSVSAGIDNVFNTNAFENHPFPQRTFFVNASFKY
ncbi:MAG: TonB-dependent receptor [Methylococcaceae bacterium]|nr:TonB-dependent receptor [Methylococcaceae bacterium]